MNKKEGFGCSYLIYNNYYWCRLSSLDSGHKIDAYLVTLSRQLTCQTYAFYPEDGIAERFTIAFNTDGSIQKEVLSVKCV